MEENRQSYVEQVSQYQLLIKSIKDDTNYFDEAKAEDGLYWSLYETYKSQIDQNKVDVSTYQAYGYTDDQIQAQLETNQGKIDEVYYSAIQSAEAKIEEANLQIASIDAQLAAVTSGQDAYEVKATTSGVLHMLGNYKSGMVVQTTTTVATITPENSQRFLEAYVSTSDMARMHEGDSVQVVVDGLSQNVYGTISGMVSRIDSNVTTQESSDGSASQAFKVMIVLNQDYVLSREGDKVDITNGMTAVARIRYDKVTYFNYVLEKLGIKTKKMMWDKVMKLRSKIQILAVLFILCIGMTYPIMPAFATELIDEDTGADDNAGSNITDNVIDNSTDGALDTSQKQMAMQI